MTPQYPHEPIANLNTLCLALGLTASKLKYLQTNSDSYFFITKEIVKPDQSIRQTFDVKPELKRIHERICSAFLRKVDYPNYLQGSIKKRDYLSNCALHTNKKLVISEDVTNFFPSISSKIVHEMWVGVFKFSNEIASILTDLVCFKGWLVQGAKPSSFICNLILWNREARLVLKLNSMGLTYTRYVDDITVSSSMNLSKSLITEILSDIYGMLGSVNAKPNRKKHKLMPNGSRQNVHRVNVNTDIPTLPKKERNKVKAAVHECSLKFKADNSSIEYKSLYNSTLGRVNNLARMHPKLGKELRTKLIRFKPII
ncbi:reverse transcriptase family protein [Pseudoalteromonas spongiae]|uniref:reverse transcriptase family protein n=1 Tax=Pseudoalteromonas spongiae TaxID=298657 RepID=UPI000C2D1F9A|nr:reverse transcriptase family protein [Pseudoalteromonas spongiae]